MGFLHDQIWSLAAKEVKVLSKALVPFPCPLNPTRFPRLNTCAASLHSLGTAT